MSRPNKGVAARRAAARPRAQDRLEAVRFTVPPRPTAYVPRARLHRSLDEGVKGPLTLVSAPAGTGKTVLVSSWLRALPAGTAAVWLSLDDSGLGPARFWHLLVMGMSRQGVDVPDPTSGVDDVEDPSFTASVAMRILAHPEPVVLVLDCEAALPHDVASRVDALLRRAGDRLRIVLLTRQDPVLPLHRYRLAGTLAELRTADLAFTTDEARQLLRGTGVDLSTTAMDAVTSRTQGWAAGLRMAAMSLIHRTDREDAARRLAGDSGTVAEYLLAEVLDTQPRGVRKLLLETSVVDVLRPGLVTALAGAHAERALNFLVHGNAFLEEVPDLPGCYRYHLLFQELLRAQLAYESPERSVELHRIAAEWLAEHGYLADAVRLAAATGDWESAARFVVDDGAIAPLLTAGATDPLLAALGRIPRSADGPAASIVVAARAEAAHDIAGGAAGIRRARRKLAATDEPWPEAELAVDILELVHERQAGDPHTALAVAAAAREALARQHGPVAAHPELEAVIESCRGGALVLLGQVDDAATAFANAAATSQVAGAEHPLVDALANGALLAALRGQLRRAAELARHAVRVSSAAGLTPTACPGTAEVALAYVHVEWFDLAAARSHVARAAECQEVPSALPRAMLTLAKARLSRADGNLDEALAVLDDELATGSLPEWLVNQLVRERTGVLVASGRESEVETAGQGVEDPIPLHGPGSTPAARVDSLLQSASRHMAAGSARRAVRDLEHALRLAAPEMLRRPFREAPDEVWYALRQHDELLLRHSWLTRRPVRRQGPGVPRARTAPDVTTEGEKPRQIVEPLTDKEREVLGHLSELMTTEEIAAAMFISVNTVRTHVRNILRKLAASRRNEAVRRARDLHIIPS